MCYLLAKWRDPEPLGDCMKRREFITLLGGTAAGWPLSAGAQQSARPVIGLLASDSAASFAGSLASVRQGLADQGYVEGRNVAIEYRYADLAFERLPAMATDLVQRRVAVIFATGSVRPAVAAKAATKTIPIVFLNGSDPIKLDLVTSLGRPGGNVTGMTLFGSELGVKRLDLLHEMLPKAERIAFLVNPGNPNAESDIANVQAAAKVIGVQILPIDVNREAELEAAFERAVQQRADALLPGPDPVFNNEGLGRLIALAAQHRMPAIFGGSPPVGTYRGQLMSYSNADDIFRQAGVYIGRILKGEKPGDLPVLQPTRFNLIINLTTARALGITVPLSLLTRADEVIE
jgi:putative tryptophan/tyrosine transport system substrate-binding protein